MHKEQRLALESVAGLSAFGSGTGSTSTLSESGARHANVGGSLDGYPYGVKSLRPTMKSIIHGGVKKQASKQVNATSPST